MFICFCLKTKVNFYLQQRLEEHKDKNVILTTIKCELNFTSKRNVGSGKMPNICGFKCVYDNGSNIYWNLKHVSIFFLNCFWLKHQYFSNSLKWQYLFLLSFSTCIKTN